MHVHKKQKQRYNFNFMFENKKVEYCEQYKYLGVTLNQNLNFEKSIEELTGAAGRALGGIITKMIKSGGFPLKFSIFCMSHVFVQFQIMVQKSLGSTSMTPLKNFTTELSGLSLGFQGQHLCIIGIRSEINWLEQRPGP